MQTDRFEKINIKQQLTKLPKRSLSYNDLKKKRLLRSQKSRNKLKSEHNPHQISQTQKKPAPNHFSIGSSTQPKQTYNSLIPQKSFLQLKQNSSILDKQSTTNKSKKYIISKPFYTERIMNENKKSSVFSISNIQNPQKNSFLENMETVAGNQKELIKQIISKKKSQRMLIKFDQIRAELKRSKSKSSRSKLNALQEDTASNSNVHISNTVSVIQPNKSKKNLRVNKFETVKQRSDFIFKSSNTQNIAKNPTIQILKRQPGQFTTHYQSRRRLKIQDFKTQRIFENKQINQKQNVPKFVIQKQQSAVSSSSSSKLKFHRRLKKCHSEIVLKMKNKQKQSVNVSITDINGMNNKNQQFKRQSPQKINKKSNSKNYRPQKYTQATIVSKSSSKTPSPQKINKKSSSKNYKPQKYTQATIIHKSQKIRHQKNFFSSNPLHEYQNKKINNFIKQEPQINHQPQKNTKLKPQPKPKPESNNQFQQPKNLQLLDISLQKINISQIQIKKQTYSLDISNDLQILKTLQDQEIDLKMKLEEQKQRQYSNQSYKLARKSPKLEIKMLKKQRKVQENRQGVKIKKKQPSNSININSSNKDNKVQQQVKNQKAANQNAQNMQNLSNILDFLSLPTKQLKIKINKCTKLTKKKNELQKFKKIFPMNFFNNN